MITRDPDNGDFIPDESAGSFANIVMIDDLVECLVRFPNNPIYITGHRKKMLMGLLENERQKCVNYLSKLK